MGAISRALVSSAICLCAAACSPSDKAVTNGAAVAGGEGAINLEQGWSAEVQQRAWFTSFGSRLIPTRWLQALELSGNDEPFMSERNLEAIGFLLQAKTPANPEGFPVGFTQQTDAEGRAWTGLGCAACHTGEVRYQGHRIRIDGGQGTLDFNLFELSLAASLQATINHDASFRRFAAAQGVAADQLDALKQEVSELADRILARHRMNEVTVPYGHGRLDAFGQIFNAVSVQFLGLPQNRRAPDAPVSFPVLWDAPHLDVVQWNGSAPNAGPGPLLQNITTALAVYGSLDIHRPAGIDGYASSIDFAHLDQIENDLYALQSPQWPSAILGALDAGRVGRGAQIYSKECVSCHQLSERNDPKRELKAVITPLDEVGTDPRMARNFLDSVSDSGAFEGRKQGVVFGPELEARAQTSDLVVHAAVGAALGHPLESVRNALMSFHREIGSPLNPHPDGYKARPLSGIWASAPYLHNGSVPTLAELLKAPSQRASQFFVGSRQFDPQTVGLATARGENADLFDTSLPGNSNAGHAYGTDLADDAKRDLLEYLKSL